MANPVIFNQYWPVFEHNWLLEKSPNCHREHDLAAAQIYNPWITSWML